LFGTRWKVDTIVAGDGGTIAPDRRASSVPAGANSYLAFDGDGGVAGSTGCWPISGSAVVSGDRITITVDPTPACVGEAEEVHAAVLAALSGDVEYGIDGSRLTLRGPSGAGLGLQAKADSPFGRTRLPLTPDQSVACSAPKRCAASSVGPTTARIGPDDPPLDRVVGVCCAVTRMDRHSDDLRYLTGVRPP
jgi:hypothetical protein